MNNTALNTKKTHSPIITISKKGQMKKGMPVLIRVIAIAVALLICAVVSTILTKKDPGFFFAQLFSGVFGTERRIWQLLEKTAILLIIAVAITPAFKMKFWNIGAEGQVLVGSLASVACIVWWGGEMSNSLLLIVMVIFSMILSAIWALIPALFKAQWNTNETLFTLMMNYIAMRLVAFSISKWVPNGSMVMGFLKHGQLPGVINNQSYIINIAIIAVATILIYAYLNYSKHGYELSIVGESINTAKYVGINVKKVIIRTMILSGVLCGLAGFIIVAGDAHTISENVVAGRGFTAILVSWLAKFNPLYMLVTSVLVIFFEQGSAQVASAANLGSALPNIVSSIFFFVLIASEFFINYKVNFHIDLSKFKKNKSIDKKESSKEVKE